MMRICGITGYRNAGKTGLVERLIAECLRRGLRVSSVKHAHHAVETDQPGKDSHRHRSAGARQVILSTDARWALTTELRGQEPPSLGALLARLDPVDLVLIEGYKRDSHPKIEVHRAATGHPLIAPGDPTVLAVAADGPLAVAGRRHFHLDDTAAIADYILTEPAFAGGVP